jgi:hypothetical protein
LAHGNGVVVAPTFLVEEVSGSLPGRDTEKTIKIVPTAALLGAGHITVTVGAVITFSRQDLQGMD